MIVFCKINMVAQLLFSFTLIALVALLMLNLGVFICAWQGSLLQGDCKSGGRYFFVFTKHAREMLNAR